MVGTPALREIAIVLALAGVPEVLPMGALGLGDSFCGANQEFLENGRDQIPPPHKWKPKLDACKMKA